MKKFLIVLNIAICSLFTYQVAHAEAELKKVCRDEVVKGKTVQKCKTIKVHKKYEGTKVPEKAPAKTNKKN